ncbi:MAG: signal peptide peptidase SppA [Proteobacteria bacterium]|nr:signal peptide peptidase SppA [Pseudomonadota bacterium]
MSLSSDNFTALVHLRDQARKWKTIALIIFLLTILLLSKVIFKSNQDIANVGVGKDYIASISIEGMIFDEDHRNKVLRGLADQKNVKAVIVNINSPGGGIVGSEILYENLRKIAQNKPIVVVMGSLAASGGYLASLASDYIIARNGTLTGSIGVIMQTSEITRLADKLGVKFLTYKSSDLKGVPSPFEKTSPQADRVISESVADSYQFFSDLVVQRREGKLREDQISKVKDGRIFTGRQALENGLIDEIGGRDEALRYLKEIHEIDIDTMKIVDVSTKKPEGEFLQKFFGQTSIAGYLNLDSKSHGLMSVLP